MQNTTVSALNVAPKSTGAAYTLADSWSSLVAGVVQLSVQVITQKGILLIVPYTYVYAHYSLPDFRISPFVDEWKWRQVALVFVGRARSIPLLMRR
jgi:hypothetical protein